jgi:hypothetical protein
MKIKQLSDSILDLLKASGLTLLQGVPSKKIGLVPDLMQLPGVTVILIKGKYKRVGQVWEQQVFPLISIASKNLRSEQERRNMATDLLEAVASCLIDKTFGGICSPLEPIEWKDEQDYTELEPGVIVHRVLFSTEIEVEIEEIDDPSVLLTSIVNTYRLQPDNFDVNIDIVTL